MNISAAILAGGKCKRFNGINKCLIEIKGEKIINIQINKLRKIFNEILIISNSDISSYINSDIKIYPDIINNAGPLGGIHSALSNSIADNVFVLSCDMPFFSESFIAKMIDAYLSYPESKSDFDIVTLDSKIPTSNGKVNKNNKSELIQALVPFHKNGIEPLHSIYNKSLVSNIEQAIKNNNLKIRNIYNENVKLFRISNADFNTSYFFNINKPGDIEKAKDF